LLKSISGIGRILGLTIIYEIVHIDRFESVQKLPPMLVWLNAKPNQPVKAMALREKNW
jgi:hypothetical protein